MKYLIEVKDNKKFIKILEYFKKKFAAFEVFISFVRISFYNDNDVEEEYIDLDRKYFNIKCNNILKFSVIKKDLLNIVNSFDKNNNWFLCCDNKEKIIFTDTKKGYYIL